MDPQTAERLNKQDDKLDAMEQKLDTIMEMVYLGRHLMAFCKFLGWCGGAYLAVETYIKTFIHK